MTNTLSHPDNSFGIDAARMRELLEDLSCPLCGGTRETSLLVVVDAPAKGLVVRAQCVSCHLFWSFAVDSETAPAMPVEASAAPEQPITGDELSILHDLLERHQGPLDQLLWRRAS